MGLENCKGEWLRFYEPLLGHKLLAVVFEPISADTPSVVAQMNTPSVAYSGCTLLKFDQEKIARLTWQGQGPMGLVPAVGKNAFNVSELDRISASWTQGWDLVQGGNLTCVELFADKCDPELVIGARHTLEANNRSTSLWVGTTDCHTLTAGAAFLEPMDDLWVAVGTEPINLSELTRLKRITNL
jgi:hypothetical protein